MATTITRKKTASAGKGLALAAQLYTLRDHLAKPDQVPGTLRRVAKIGFRNVQLSGGCLMSMNPLELRGILDDAGLKAVGHHTSYEQLSAEFDRVVDALHALGIRYTAIAWCGESYRGSAARWKKTAKLFSQMGQRLAAEGITLQYHNHQFEFERFAGQVGLEILFGHSDPKYLQAELDTAWVAAGFQDPAAWISRLKGRVDQIHAKDIQVASVEYASETRVMEVGRGALDWPGILAACRKAGVRDILIEQDGNFMGGDPFKSLAASFNYLSGLLNAQ